MQVQHNIDYLHGKKKIKINNSSTPIGFITYKP